MIIPSKISIFTEVTKVLIISVFRVLKVAYLFHIVGHTLCNNGSLPARYNHCGICAFTLSSAKAGL